VTEVTEAAATEVVETVAMVVTAVAETAEMVAVVTEAGVVMGEATGEMADSF
jgi:hypothetical protein